MPNPSQRPDATPPSPDGARGRALLARKWTYLLSGVVVIPLNREELDQELREQLEVICEALLAGTFDAVAVEQVGDKLVTLGYVGEPGLRCTLDVLGKGLLSLPEFRPVERFAEPIVAVLSALACGFLAGSQRIVLRQQESLHLSLLKAVRDANWNLKQSEARFDEVATSSASGIMIIDLDGRLERANTALAEMLGISAAELTGASVFDLVHPDSVQLLRDGMASVLEGTMDRFRQLQRLRRADGDIARISLTASLLRGADDAPSHFFLVAEDGTELMLLQGELHRQALHDVTTGLPNRQFFGTHLESVLRRADSTRGITLFHLALDGFAMVCNSLGRRAGEQLLVHVAGRLKTVVAQEKAMIARFDGDEFAIVVENSATTPDVAATAAKINEELAEPFYVDGHGVAVSASIGVVHRPPRDFDPAELLRAADLTLRRAKAGRRGQWELFHPDEDVEDRRVQLLAVSMAGAWERGEIGVHYRPMVDLGSDGNPVAGMEALLRWDRPDGEVLPHSRCIELAEQTGLILSLGEWLLRVSAGQAQWWHQQSGFDHPVSIGLTPHQSADADLVSRLVRVLEDTGLRPGQLMVGMPVAVLPMAVAADNLIVLSDMGVRTVIDDFGLGPGDVAAIEDLHVRFVRVARGLTERLASTDPAYVGTLMPRIRQAGATVIVDGIGTEDQANWWRKAGAGLATGEYFGTAGPPADILA